MKRWLIEKLGGYPDVASAIDAVRGMGLGERHKVLTLAVRRLFNTISQDDILKIHNGNTWLFQGKTMNKGQIHALQIEARQFKEGTLWKILATELRYIANKKMFLQSEDVVDIVAGKLVLYYIEQVEKRLENMVVPDK